MANINFHKVTTMPSTPEANSVYFAKPTISSELAEVYITDINGDAKPIISSVNDLTNPNTIDVPTTLAVKNAVDNAVLEAETLLYDDEVFDTI